MIYLIGGTEIYESFLYKQKLCNEFGKQPDLVTVFDGLSKDFRLQDFLVACQTISLFEEKKLVIVNNPYFLINKKIGKKEKGEEDYQLLAEFINHVGTDVEVIFYLDNQDFDRRTKIYKLFDKENGKKVRIMQFSQKPVYELERMIQQAIGQNHLTLSKQAKEELIKRIGGNTTQYYKAFENILLYGEKTLNYDDIVHLVPVNQDVNVFKFANSFVQGDIQSMLHYLSEMITIERIPYTNVIPLLAYQLRNLYMVKRCFELGYSIPEIKKITGRNYPDKDLGQVEKITSYTLLKTLASLANVDQTIKSGQLEDKYAFEQFLIRSLQDYAITERII